MSSPIIKKIALMASHDWTLRAAMAEFLDFVDPVIRWEGREYRIELTRAIAKPLAAGTDPTGGADLILDRTTHWNGYYKSWAHQAMNSLASMVNHSYTFAVYDKHSTYDLMSRAMHPEDRFPKTVLLPQFQPWSGDQKKQALWEYEQRLIIENTEFGFDEKRKKTDMETVRRKIDEMKRFERRSEEVRKDFYYSGEYLREVVEDTFENRFPLYLKKAYGGGGSQVYKIDSLDELYSKYDGTAENTFHLQEGIEPYEVFYRAMGIGPVVIPMKFQPDHPHYQHYSPEKLVLDRDVFHRLESYVLFINSYHRWTYNSFESLLKDGSLHPIDFANACPDSQLISLHVHFPTVICALLKWLSFCVVTEKDMKINLEMTDYLSVLNNPDMPQIEKFEFCRTLSDKYFETARFNDFCGENFPDLEDRMIDFFDAKFDEIIRYAVEFSDFPEHEHETFYAHYKGLMEETWRPNARKYLEPVILGG